MVAMNPLTTGDLELFSNRATCRWVFMKNTLSLLAAIPTTIIGTTARGEEAYMQMMSVPNNSKIQLTK